MIWQRKIKPLFRNDYYDQLFKLDSNKNMFNNFVEKQFTNTDSVINNKKRPRKGACNEDINKSEKKSNESVSEVMKKSRRLMINKISAQKCRQKKKKYINDLENRIKLLETESSLHKQNLQLESNFCNIISNVHNFF